MQCVVLSNTEILERVRHIFHEGQVALTAGISEDILGALQKLNPKHLYYRSDNPDRILFFGDSKNEVFPRLTGYDDIVMVQPYIFASPFYFRHTYIKGNVYRKIIIDNELLLTELLITLGLNRFNAIGTLERMLAERLQLKDSECRYFSYTDEEQNEFLFNTPVGKFRVHLDSNAFNYVKSN